MNDELGEATFGERELPRWAQVIAGLVLGLITLFCDFAFIIVFLASKRPILGGIVEMVFLLPCLWVLEKCFLLVTGKKKKGGLLSPQVLRTVAFLLLVLPIAGFFTGYYRDAGPVAIFQAVMYLLGFFGVRAFARKRETEQLSSKSEAGAGNRT